MLSVGLVGGSARGGWALSSHIPAIARMCGIELVAVATSTLDGARRSAEILGARNGYVSAFELAQDPRVDLVTVAVKVPQHFDTTAAAIQAGKDVYCEWPLARNTTEARELRDLAAVQGVRTYVGLQARLSPEVLKLRELVSAGFLGRILSVHAFSGGQHLGGPVLPADREWAADVSNGLSALTVRAAHSLDVVEFCAGHISEICAEVFVATPHPRIASTGRQVTKTAPDQVLVIGKLACGASVSGEFLLGVHPPKIPLISIMGTMGTASISTDSTNGQIQLSRLTCDVTIDGRSLTLGELGADQPELGVTPFEVVGVARMYEAIRDGAVGVPDFAHAVRLHELLDTLVASSTAGSKRLLR